jgi:hypothetical protein
MQRLAVALLIVGALLLASWVTAGDRPSAPRATAELNQVTPVVSDVNREVDQLRERLAVDSRFVAPSRDPFRFRGRPAPPPVMSEPAIPEPVVAPPPMPQLVAILTDSGPNGVTRRAVFAFGGNVSIVKPGDTLDRFVVGRVDADAVELTERATSNVVRVSIK